MALHWARHLRPDFQVRAFPTVSGPSTCNNGLAVGPSWAGYVRPDLRDLICATCTAPLFPPPTPSTEELCPLSQEQPSSDTAGCERSSASSRARCCSPSASTGDGS